MSNVNACVDQKPLFIGILGAARIAKKNCRAASHPSTCCKIAAIASRSKEKGEDFVSELFGTNPSSAPAIYGGDSAYFNLIVDKSCDAVYIPLPTKLHKQYVIRALEIGKHVLLEKPVANSADEYRQMLLAASKSGKFLMDGTMFVHHPRTEAFVKSIPNPTRVHFNFTFDGDINFHQNDIRTKKNLDFMGCIGDLGWYCTRMGLLVFSGADARNLKGLVTGVQTARYELNDDGVPLVAECIVHFTEVGCHMFNLFV
jgi:predicted dehydrogenase